SLTESGGKVVIAAGIEIEVPKHCGQGPCGGCKLCEIGIEASNGNAQELLTIGSSRTEEKAEPERVSPSQERREVQILPTESEDMDLHGEQQSASHGRSHDAGEQLSQPDD